MMMKTYILVSGLLVASLAPAQTSAKAAASKKTAAATKRDPSLPEGVPDGAKSYKPYYWRWVDKKGVAWIYHTTPFGVVHDEENADDRAEMAAIKAKTSAKRPDMVPGDLVVVDKGDSLEFTRPTPFGASRWTTKKTELNEEEAAAWARTQAAAAAQQQRPTQ